MFELRLEFYLLWAAVLAYLAAGSLAAGGVLLRRLPERSVLALMLGGLVLQTAFFAMRWDRLGHGPFNSMFEILASNIWSLLLVFVIAYWRIRPIRPSAALVMPIIFVMVGWLIVASPHDTQIPPTYDTVWLYIHIGLGKVFLGAILVAVGLGLVILARTVGLGREALAILPDNASLDELAYRFLALGLVFDTLMLIAGAIWAQDAWGRYWNWDPIETWGFVTWLLLASTIHFRFTFRPHPAWSALLAIAVFAVAFVNFFGIPFVSRTPHQGMV